MDRPENLSQRQALIVDRVADLGFVTIDMLARDMDVSTQTIRREIIRLDEAGLIQRFHGGAGRRQSAERLTYQAKKHEQSDIKQRIGATMAREILDGQAVFLDVGTTVEALAQALAERSNLTVVTTSLASANILNGNQRTRVIVTGGEIAGPDGSLVGPLAQSCIAKYRFDWSIIGASGIDEHGDVVDFDANKIAIKQVAIKRARRSALVVDSSKFLRPALLTVAPLSAFSLLVSDASLPASLRKAATRTKLKTA